MILLTINPQGTLQLGADREGVDWLVKMHRLPADVVVGVASQKGTVKTQELDQIVQLLVHVQAERSRPIALLIETPCQSLYVCQAGFANVRGRLYLGDVSTTVADLLLNHPLLQQTAEHPGIFLMDL